MKKFFTLFFALFVMTFFANAQYAPLIESFEQPTCPAPGWTIVYGNNDPSVNAMTHSTTTATVGSRSFRFSSYSSTSDYTQYLISPALPSGNLTVSFDYSGHTSGTETFHVGFSTTTADPASFTWGAEMQSTSSWQTVTENVPAGATYVAIKYTSNYQYYLYIDNFKVVDPTVATLIANPDTLTFSGSVNNNTNASSVNVMGIALTGDITASTSAPFEISLYSDSAFSTNATITHSATNPMTNATLYVRYNPTAAGEDNSTLTLSSGSMSAEIALIGNAVDCSNLTLPVSESFETADCPAPCWSIVYANGDPTGNPMTHSTSAASVGSKSFRFSSYSTTSDYTQFLISPALPTGNRLLTFDYMGEDETFHVGFSSTTADTASFTWGEEMQGSDDWQTAFIEVPTNAVYAAIKYTSEYAYYLYIDNFVVSEPAEASITVNPKTMSFPSSVMGQPTTAKTATVTAIALTNDITISADSPYEVSTDNNTFGPTATITASTGIVTEGTLYVRYNPTAEGSDDGFAILTSGTATDTIVLTGSAVDCAVGIATFPFHYGFDDGVVPPTCWSYDTVLGFASFTFSDTTEDRCIAIGNVNYMITPEIHSAAPLYMSIDYHTYGGYNGFEASSTFRIGYSSTNDIYSSFTWLTPVAATSTDPEFTTYTAMLPAGTKYVAIEATEIGTFSAGWFSYYNYLFFDNFGLTEVTNPLIYAGATNIDFGTIHLGADATETVAVIGAMLTTDITATATTPFEVSADNTTFGTTATIPAAGGNLYVRYTPTAEGSHTGNVTLSSTGATDVQVSLTGNAIDCPVMTLPFEEDFEGVLDECWTMIDADGDGHIWETRDVFVGHDEGKCISSASYDNVALTPDNWLITPAINLSTEANLSFWVNAQDASYPAEHYGVYISTTGTNVADFTMLFEETMDATGGPRAQGIWKQKVVNLSAYTGQDVYIAFRHFNCSDMFWLNIDDIYVGEGVGINNMEDQTISVYPNPANNYINVNASSNISNVEVYNISGQKIGDFTANGTSTVINTGNLSCGLYLMRINTENGVVNKKFSVVR